MSKCEFTVWVFQADDWHYPLMRYVDAKTAAHVAKRACDHPGDAQRIIITDGGDHTCFEWKRGEGVTYPPREAST